jgi:hypothetical protein
MAPGRSLKRDINTCKTMIKTRIGSEATLQRFLPAVADAKRYFLKSALWQQKGARESSVTMGLRD